MVRGYRTSDGMVYLGLLIVLSLTLSSCDTGIASSTAPALPYSSLSPRPAPITTAIATNSAPAPTPIARGILTPLPTSDVIPSSTKPACTPLATPSALPYPGRVGQIWYAEQIVIGSVVARETRWEGNSNYQVIRTYSLFRVEQQVRGVPVNEMLITQRGGTLNGCTQQNSERLLNRDGRLMLFLGRYDTPTPANGSAPAIYYVMFGDSGIYDVTSTTAGTPTTRFIADTRQILSQPPPANLSNYWIIPLDRAPLAPPPEATPQH